ncbi:FkbM family methyltransferase [Vineibacter terrae]|uniref:FkbM family methyltransferase n=1 Tax=Vineibacter terrae TaxID=2586908 RepID=UPI002E31BECE|nr:FkbM family methyltransferase [Vineibacter terrae]HEX2891080.1 FkbM family methyltransferase [Vineibacter terrae]
MTTLSTATAIVPPHALALDGFALSGTIPARMEKLARRLLRARNPDCAVVKRLRRLRHASADGLGHLTVRTPDRAQRLHYRFGTSDEDVIWQIFGGGDYDLTRLRRFDDIGRLVERRAAAGQRPLIIDAGANIGVSAVFFALTFPTAVVVAIEPEAANFTLLERNTQGLGVHCRRAALSAEAGHATVHDGGEGPWSFRTEKAAQPGGGVPCLTINDLFAAHAGPDVFPFLVKIDIEGGEEDVFGRNTQWVAQTPVIITELHDWLLPGQRTALPFLRCISALDRDFVYLGEDVFSIDNRLAD